jgi:acetyl esterase/lipase
MVAPRLTAHRSALVVVALLLAACSTSDRTTAPHAGTTPAGSPADTGSAGAGPATTDECRSAPSAPEEVAYRSIDGVDANLTSLDIYLPQGCGPAPVVVWVHGGGWRRGDKRHTAQPKAELAAEAGAALVAVNYRLSTPGTDVMWPDHGNDVAAAIAWIISDGAAHGLDPSRIALMGHSAGGHLVSIVVTDPALLEGAGASAGPIVCVVALDSAAFDLRGSPAELSGLVPNAFGDDEEVIGAASPQVQVERNSAPAAEFLVVTRGSDARVAGAQRFVDAVNDGGGTAALMLARPYSHEEVNLHLGEPGEQIVTPGVGAFLDRCLAG